MCTQAVVLPVALPLAAGSLVGAFAGAQVASYMPEDTLKYLFFAAMLVLGGRNIVKAFK